MVPNSSALSNAYSITEPCKQSVSGAFLRSAGKVASREDFSGGVPRRTRGLGLSGTDSARLREVSHSVPRKGGFRALAVWALFVLTLVPSSVFAQGTCTPLAQVSYVRNTMTDMYLWYREVPALNRLRFDGPEDYLAAARYRPLDSTFSYITTSAANTAFYSDSEYVGFGFSNVAVANGLRVTQVFPASPASEAGLRRGDLITQIDGRTVAELLASDALDQALGDSSPGVQRELTVVRGDASTRLRLTKRAVVIPTVSDAQVFEVRGRRVGYLLFRNFVQPSLAALDAAFAEFRRAQVTELVLDVRYNGGGLVSVAQHLASLIGGTLTRGQVLSVYSHNDKNTDRNETLRFTDPPQALSLSRLVMITTRASASASELVANALRPFMPVVLIGDRTYGKPVGQYGFEFCSKVLALVSFSLKNADGQGDYFGGLAPTCVAADDLDHELGDPAESSLREALAFIDSGTCASAAAAEARSRPRSSPLPFRGGWRELVGAD